MDCPFIAGWKWFRFQLLTKRTFYDRIELHSNSRAKTERETGMTEQSDSADAGAVEYPDEHDIEFTDETRPYRTLIRHIKAFAEASPIEAFEIAAIVIDKIAVAQTPDEIFAANESGPADMEVYLNRPLDVYNPRFAPSAEKFRKGGLGYYVVFDCTPDGVKTTVSTGAPNVVAPVFRLVQLDFIGEDKAFPLVVRGRETPNGTLFTCHAVA